MNVYGSGEEDVDGEVFFVFLCLWGGIMVSRCLERFG